ncbi:MAG: hypothetical protein QW097_01010 [archaeon]
MVNRKSVILSACVFILTLSWILLVANSGLKINYIYDFVSGIQYFLNNIWSLIVLFLSVGILISISVVLVKRFSLEISTKEAFLISFLPSFVAFAIGSMFFDHKIAVFIFGILYAFGLGISAINIEEIPTGIKKIFFSAGCSKTIILSLCLAALISGILITQMEFMEKQEVFKNSIIEIVQKGMKVSMTKEEIRGIVERMKLNESEIYSLAEEQAKNIPNFEQLPEAEKQRIINSLAEKIREDQEKNLEKQTEILYEKLGKIEEESKSMIGTILEKTAIFQELIKYLPLWIGLVWMSILSVFGIVFIQIPCFLICLLCPSGKRKK